MSKRNSPANRRERRHPERIGLQEAADRLGVCYRTMRRYVSNGTLDAVRVGPRLLKVDAAAVEALMQPVGGGATYPEGVNPPQQPKPRTRPAIPQAPPTTDDRKAAVDAKLSELDSGGGR
ncbi:helix-turn-helix domain-containing protein [Mycobacterium persicum]|uniref:helix-turn-helix domain-containing protein n=1 Tax=Mycobacterium persicum TaxID=1487726 RepID=UPI0015934CCD|nr:helix-turn-helix domain-containing protein [Mycobacterium persicum]